MRTATELKQIFQRGWNISARVDNYLRQSPEFTEGDCYDAWRRALSFALDTTQRLKILDVGTGPGFFACLYSQLGHAAAGLDFSERMLGVARRRAEELNVTVQFIYGDAESPPFDNGTFDVVSSRHLLFNLPRPGVAVREWIRVLKPGGRLVLIGNEPDKSPSGSRRRMRRRVRRRHGRGGKEGAKPGWKPEPGYIDAVMECPLFQHGSGVLRAVMEAGGLEDIHHVATDELQEARRRDPDRTPYLGGQSRMFILVGVKRA